MTEKELLSENQQLKDQLEKYRQAFDEAVAEMETLSDKARTNADYWTIRWCINMVKKRKEDLENG